MPTLQKNITEEELLHLLATNGKDGMHLLYEKYASALFGIILKIVGSEKIAEDVLQDSFLKIWSNITTYDKSKGRLFTWMLNIARNRAIDYTRSKNFKTISYTTQTSNLETNNTQLNIDHIGLLDLVNQLKPEIQNVMNIVYFKGYTHIEAAEFLNLPLGTVKGRVRKGLKILRQIV
ncbi:MAG: RNA polymerase sigma factor (sigma-70 family) [Crocinitomix sp.]